MTHSCGHEYLLNSQCPTSTSLSKRRRKDTCPPSCLKRCIESVHVPCPLSEENHSVTTCRPSCLGDKSKKDHVYDYMSPVLCLEGNVQRLHVHRPLSRKAKHELICVVLCAVDKKVIHDSLMWAWALNPKYNDPMWAWAPKIVQHAIMWGWAPKPTQFLNVGVRTRTPLQLSNMGVIP